MSRSATTPSQLSAADGHASRLSQYGKKYQLETAVPSAPVDSPKSTGRCGAKKSGKKGPGPKLAR